MSLSSKTSPSESNCRNYVQLGVNSAVVALVVLLFAACQSQDSQQEPTAVDTVAIKSALDSLRSSYEENYAKGDIGRAIKMVAHSEVIYSPPGSPVIRGLDSAIAHEKQARPPGATIDIEPIEVHVMSPEWVYEFGTATISFTPQGAKTPHPMESTYLIVFRKTAEGWKAYRESVSAN